MSDLEGANLDVVKTEPAQEGYGKKMSPVWHQPMNPLKDHNGESGM